jgi:hypothetical protein
MAPEAAEIAARQALSRYSMKSVPARGSAVVAVTRMAPPMKTSSAPPPNRLKAPSATRLPSTLNVWPGLSELPLTISDPPDRAPIRRGSGGPRS